jgi:hypothetical protein
VSPVRHEFGFYIPEDCILHSHCRENLRCYIIGDTLFLIGMYDLILLVLLTRELLIYGMT